MIFGPGRMGQALVEHRGVDAISFTGSQTVGESVARTAVAMVMD